MEFLKDLTKLGILYYRSRNNIIGKQTKNNNTKEEAVLQVEQKSQY